MDFQPLRLSLGSCAPLHPHCGTLSNSLPPPANVVTAPIARDSAAEPFLLCVAETLTNPDDAISVQIAEIQR